MFATRTIHIDEQEVHAARDRLIAGIETQRAIAGELESTRHALSISGPELARASGISPHRYANLEAGRSAATISETIAILDAWLAVASGDHTHRPTDADDVVEAEIVDEEDGESE